MLALFGVIAIFNVLCMYILCISVQCKSIHPYVVYQQFTVPSICCSFSPMLSMCPFMQSPIAVLFPSTVWTSALFFCQFFMCDSFHMTIPCQPNPHQFLLTTFRNSNLHSQFILLLSSLLTPTILLTRLFSQTCTFSCCFIVSAVVFIASM